MGNKKENKMSTFNSIGLDQAKSKELSAQLNDLLANFQIFYMNARGYHWNIKGNQFFELHLKFEELYNDLLVKVDEIAERVLTLGETPLHTFSEYIEQSEIKAQKNVTSGDACISDILASFAILLKKERTILENASEINDEGTSALMGDYIREQEKLVWMYSSFLG